MLYKAVATKDRQDWNHKQVKGQTLMIIEADSKYDARRKYRYIAKFPDYEIVEMRCRISGLLTK